MLSSPKNLHRFAPEELEALAQLVADKVLAGQAELADVEPDERRLLSPAELARRLGKSRAWVYEHSRELGAIRLGDGPRPRLAFDLRIVEERIRPVDSKPGKPGSSAGLPARRRAAVRSGVKAELLPIGPKKKAPLP